MPEIAVHRYPPRYGKTPKLGPVQVQEVQADGQRLFSMKPAGAPGDAGLLLGEEAYAISAYFDGRRDLHGIQQEVHREYGQLLYREKIHELALALWRAGLLVTEVGQETMRPALFAGSAYDAEPEALRATLDATFTHPDGPGATHAPEAGVCGIVVPHIDLLRGGHVYAHAYKALVERVDADLYVVFGTAHQSPASLFTLTRADYDTPLGPVKTDPDALAILASRLGNEIFQDEAAHLDEHSIEFQALYLKHLLGDRPFSILPVLCSSLYDCAARDERPDDEPAFGRFLKALSQAVAGRKVAWIAAADLSHVGLVYGDAATPSEADLEALGRVDRESLRLLERGDAEGFFDHVSRDALTRRICGLTPIYAAMRASGAARSTLLRYDQWFGADEGSAVTFAAATLEAP